MEMLIEVPDKVVEKWKERGLSVEQIRKKVTEQAIAIGAGMEVGPLQG